MNNHVKGIIAVIGVTAIAFTIFHFMHQSQKTYARQIIKLTKGSPQSYAWLVTLDAGYLKAWAQALAKEKDSFSYNNASYDTVSGDKKIVS